ncbi:MAG: SpoIID/LytB domain-containing protein [Elusimicrobia bacterium]|nr:SpoIID/LytB domain-containing protein [Elusimicrobiota bacterium]
MKNFVKALVFIGVGIAPVLSIVLSVWARELPESIVRIMVLDKVSSLEVGSGGQFEIFDLNTGRKKTIEHLETCSVSVSSEGMTIGAEDWSGMARLIPLGDALLSLNGKKYRDTLLFKKVGDNQITVINELGIDHYLYGILPKEVDADWPMESLKSQAVVSRTFALKNLKRHEQDGFHFCSKVHCQVYGGVNGEEENTNRAVDETHNQVITYHGDLINAVFFANCGGKTEEPANSWLTSGSPPYLRSVRCKVCKGDPFSAWRKKLTQKQIAEALRKNGRIISLPIRTISILSYGRSGRAKFLSIQHAEGQLKVMASHFRMWMGPETVRSTYLQSLRKVQGEFLFAGRGWGHGIGLCQDGARGLAQKGKKYKKIAQYYYPGTQVEEWEY